MARTHTKTYTNIDVFIPNHINPGKIEGPNHPPKNRREVKRDIRMIWPYSARKNKAKVIAEYSTLNPETNSDSPSAKSNGGLLVSAKAETKNIIAIGHKGTIYQISFWANTMAVILYSPTHSMTEIIIKPIETS